MDGHPTVSQGFWIFNHRVRVWYLPRIQLRSSRWRGKQENNDQRCRWRYVHSIRVALAAVWKPGREDTMFIYIQQIFNINSTNKVAKWSTATWETDEYKLLCATVTWFLIRSALIGPSTERRDFNLLGNYLNHLLLFIRSAISLPSSVILRQLWIFKDCNWRNPLASALIPSSVILPQ